MDELTALLREHPERAMRALLKEYAGLVYFVARGILSGQPREEIEECVSDAFLYVYENRDRLDFSRGSVKAYLCAAARGRAIDRLRKLKKQNCVPFTEAMGLSDCSAEEKALSRVSRSELIDAIRALGDPDATILIGRYYLNLSTKEIAALTGLRENTADQRCRRALKKLAQTLKGGLQHVR